MKKILLLTLALFACGPDSKKSDVQSEVPQSVDFSGFVQRAFTLKVEGVSFNDSEHFYTRFIPDLIMTNPTYKDALGKSEITIEGEYGLERFAADSSVFVASMAATGHLFQARTDSQGKFTVGVKPDALDETFKARIVVRIGLLIKSGTDSLHYCYLLHSINEGVHLSESSKPIIFDDFKTQLNTYQCSDERNKGIEIPTNSTPSPDTPTTTKDDGTVVADPNVTISLTKRIPSPLPADADGVNALTAVNFVSSSKGMFILKGEYRSKTDGQYYRQLLNFKSLDSVEPAKIITDDWMSLQSASVPSHLYLPTDEGFLLLDSNYYFRYWQYTPATGATRIYSDYTGAQRPIPIATFESGGKQWVSDNWTTCIFDTNSPKLFTSCKYRPSSNPDGLEDRSIAHHGGNLYSLSYEEKQRSYWVVEYNSNLVFQKKYFISQLYLNGNGTLPQLVNLDDGLYLLQMSGSDLLFQKLQLNG